jgi:hypothetical protein
MSAAGEAGEEKEQEELQVARGKWPVISDQ